MIFNECVIIIIIVTIAVIIVTTVIIIVKDVKCWLISNKKKPGSCDVDIFLVVYLAVENPEHFKRTRTRTR